jgi:Ca-activated chloride channel homolog
MLKSAIPLLLAASLLAADIEATPLLHSATTQPEPERPPTVRSDPALEQGVKKLSRRERRERRSKLADRYQQFLFEVEPIMDEIELNAFLLLESDPQRDLFIDEFWERRNPDPRTSGNEYRERYAELLVEARQKYRNLISDPARVLLTRGRPDEVIATHCRRYLQPIEIWYYEYLPGLGQRVRLLFYQPRNSTELRLWVPMQGGLDALRELISTEADIGGGAAGVFLESAAPGTGVSKIQFECINGREIMDAIGWSQQNRIDISRVFDPPPVETEDVGRILRSAVLPTDGAARLDVTIEASYPGRRGSRTAVQMNLQVERDQLQSIEFEGANFYNLDVVGETLREGRIYETFRYRFDFPAEGAPEKLPIQIERVLRPAEYLARVKVVDINARAEAIIEQALVVPQINPSAAELARMRESSESISRLAEEFGGESRLRIVPLTGELHTGVQQIETLVSGEKITAVEFFLNNRRVMTKRAPPYTLNLDFGSVPRPHKVKVIGLDKDGEIVTGDEIAVNIGTDPFRVRIVSPRVAPRLEGSTRVEVEARAPRGRKVQYVEIFYNDARLARIFNPPYVQSVDIPEGEPFGYLRAVAKLDDEVGSETEDVVFVNSPEFMEEVQVHLVELPTTVVRGGRVVTDLSRSDFTVLDNGAAVEIAKFEYVKDLPLSLGVAIDTSGSMRNQIVEAQKAAAEFYQNILRDGDKAFLLSFDTQPQMLQTWTNSIADLHAGLAGVRAEGSTTLYDAVILSLYNFLGVRGQKALVLISDGEDTSSRFSFDQALEYARRTAVPIYVIGIGVKTMQVDLRYKLGRLASETGGGTYYITNASELRKVYDQIQNELRSQYLIGFYPSTEARRNDDWREVNVQVNGGRAKTISGYYP